MSDTKSTKKPYLNRKDFHNELAISKRSGELTRKALKMFETLCKNVSRDFFFEDPEEKKDAEARAMHDLWKYWRNFKESNVIQLKFNRKPVPGEIIKLTIHDKTDPPFILIYEAVDSNPTGRQFLIDKTINYTIGNFIKVVNDLDSTKLEVFHDKVKRVITIMDKHNNDDLSVKSFATISQQLATGDTEKGEIKEMWMINKNKDYPEDEDTHFFKEPPNAFSYFTSMVRNGIIKSINELHPKVLRDGKKISIDRINSNANGLYNM